jgi:hypothetical protein
MTESISKTKRGIKSLKVSVIISLVLIWNALIFYSVYLNGGMIFQKYSNNSAKYVMVINYGIIFMFSFLVVIYEPFRNKVISEKRKNYYSPFDFCIIGLLMIIFTTHSIIYQ